MLLLTLFLCFGDVFGGGPSVLISEVYYNPDGSEYDLEYVELYNFGNTTVNMSGWWLNTTSSEFDARIPKGTVLTPNSHFLIADKGFNIAKPVSWQEANYEEELTLSNTAGGVALVSPSSVVDTVGWGNECPQGYFETTPVEIGEEGLSLTRKVVNSRYLDTNNNLNDFTYNEPSPTHNANVYNNAKTIEIELKIKQNPPQILGVYMDDELAEKPGTQVFPFPGQVKQKEIRVVVEHSTVNFTNVSITHRNTTSKLSASTNHSIYYGMIEIPYYTPPGLDTVVVNVCSTFGCSATAFEFEVEAVLGFEVDTTKLTIAANSGGSLELLGDLDMSTSSKPTIANTGNTQLRFEVSTEGFKLNNTLIPPGFVSVALSSEPPQEYFELSEPYVTTAKLPVLGFTGLWLRFNIPEHATPGNYSGRISLKAIP